MSTPSEQSTILPLSAQHKQPEFSPPGITDLDGLTDGRPEGSYATKYSWGAWIQISVELVYLVSILLSALAGLFFLAKYVVLKETSGLIFGIFGAAENSKPLQLYLSISLSGLCGGSSSSLKWLYHSVAKRRWHRDRVVWRLVVPLLSGVLAVFTGMMVISGLVPFLSRSWLAGLTSASAFGFFVGFFSDNLLAALEKLALSAFGTMNNRSKRQSDESDAEPK